MPSLYATGNATAYTDVPFGYQDGLANARNITYAFTGVTHAAASAYVARKEIDSQPVRTSTTAL